MHPNSDPWRRQAPPAQPGTDAAAPPPPGRLATPYFSYALLGAAVIWFGVDELLLSNSHPFAIYGPAVAAGQWWRIPGAVIEHGNLIHLFFNMSVVWTMGRAYEGAIGTGRFALVSIAGLLGSSLLQLGLAFHQPAVGASGMILGWVGAMLPIATKAHRSELVTWLIQIAVISLLPFVSWQGHLGGFLAGLPCGLLLRMGPTWFKRYAPMVIAALIGLNVLAVTRGARLPEPERTRRADPEQTRQPEPEQTR